MIDKSGLYTAAQAFLRRFGFNITRASNTIDYKRAALLNAKSISLVIDVGANIGQYGNILRAMGYSGRIISFEPLKTAYRQLEMRTKRDAHWDCYNLALGRNNGEMIINVSRDLVSSSLLSVSDDYIASIPNGLCIAKDKIAIVQLDSLIENIISPMDKVHLKMDVQGYEMEVLCGGVKTLEKVQTIESEMSLLALYKGQPLMADIIQYLKCKEFSPVWLERGFISPSSGHLWQVDGLFHRTER